MEHQQPSKWGKNIGKRKLTADEVRQIRYRGAKGESHADLAEEFNVSKSAISKVIHRRSYTDI